MSTNVFNEEWRDIKDFKGLYQVSNLGRIKSLTRFVKGRSVCFYEVKEKILAQHLTHKGYLRIELNNDGVAKKFYVHRLVAEAFLENIDNLPQVNHKSGIKTDNTALNLEWVTGSDNILHAFENGLKKAKKGEDSPCCKLSDFDCNEIIKRYKSGGFTQKDLGDDYNISSQYVSKIIRGERRNYLHQ